MPVTWEKQDCISDEGDDYSTVFGSSQRTGFNVHPYLHLKNNINTTDILLWECKQFGEEHHMTWECSRKVQMFSLKMKWEHVWSIQTFLKGVIRQLFDSPRSKFRRKGWKQWDKFLINIRKSFETSRAVKSQSSEIPNRVLSCYMVMERFQGQLQRWSKFLLNYRNLEHFPCRQFVCLFLKVKVRKVSAREKG